MDKDKWLLVGDASELLGVSPETLRRWRWQDKIHPRKDKINGYWYYSITELKEIKKQRGKK